METLRDADAGVPGSVPVQVGPTSSVSVVLGHATVRVPITQQIRERAREIRRLREMHPGWTNAEIRKAAEPCPDCAGQERACESCWAAAHADDHDERGV